YILAARLRQDLRTAPWDRVQPGRLQPKQRLFQRELADLCDVDQLHRGKGVPDDSVFPELLFDAPQQLLIPRQLQLRIDTALHEDLDPTNVHHLLDLAVDLLEREDVPLLMPRYAVERAVLASHSANVGVIHIPPHH